MALRRKISTNGNGHSAAAIERATTMTAPATIVAGNWDQTTHQELANITEQLKVLSARVANAPQLQQYLGSALFNLGCAWGYGQLAMTSPAAQSSSTHGAEA